MRHLILSLSRSGTGESQVGLGVGRELLARGHHVAVVCDPTQQGVFRGSGLDVHVAPPEGWGEIEPVIAGALAGRRPDGVLLADFAMASNALERRRVPAGLLGGLGGRMVVIDTWHAPEAPVLDAHPGDQLRFSPALTAYPYRMAPVPFIRPDAPHAFSILPEPPPRVPRAEIGLPDGPVVLIASSAWQHVIHQSPRVRAIQEVGLRALAQRLAALPDAVHVIQIGPVPLRLKESLGARYRWIPSLAPGAFRQIVASVDLVVSLNAAATTNALAVSAGVPVLTLMNSEPGPFDGVELYPFLMWPYSLWEALTPILRDNPYGRLLNLTELRDPDRFVREAMALIGDRARRQEEDAVRMDYLGRVGRLPSGATLYLRHLES